MEKRIKRLIDKESKVVSLQYGVGKIVGNFTMYDGVDDYLQIVYSVDNKLRYLCVRHTSDVRPVSSKVTIEKALRTMNLKLNDITLDNDSHDYHASFFDKDVIVLTQKIINFFRKEDLTINDNIKLQKLLDSLINEVGEVYNVDQSCARGIVSDYLKSA